MFDIGGYELIVIAAVAILVVGPRELPGMLRAVGKFVGQARKMSTDVQRQFNAALKEAELDGVKKTLDDVRSLNPATQIRKTIAKEMQPFTQAGDSVKEAVGKVGSSTKAAPSASQAPAKAPTTGTQAPAKAPTASIYAPAQMPTAGASAPAQTPTAGSSDTSNG